MARAAAAVVPLLFLLQTAVAFRAHLSTKSTANEEVNAFDGGKKVLVYGGCFCPPHKGHFAQVQRFYDQYDEIYPFLFAGAQERHGYSPDINIKIWQIYKQLLPQGGPKVKFLPGSGSFANGEPYLEGTTRLVQHKLLGKGDQLTVVVGDDYDEDRVRGIQQQLDWRCVQAGCKADVQVMNRAADGSVSASKFCDTLDEMAAAPRADFKKGDCVIYTSSRGNGRYHGVVVHAGEGSYTVQLPLGPIINGRMQVQDYQHKQAKPDQLLPCGLAPVLDKKKLNLPDLVNKFLPEGLNEQQLAHLRDLLATKSKLG